MRLFRILVPAALMAGLVALAVAWGTGANSATTAAIVPAPPFTPGQEQSEAAGNDWLTVGGGLNDNRHSTLTQITAANVSSLHLAWTGTFNMPAKTALIPEEGAALAYKGTLFIPNGLNAVMAVDGMTGKTLWSYNPHNDNPALLPAVRGVALGDGKVFEGQNDGNVVALDQTTGQ